MVKKFKSLHTNPFLEWRKHLTPEEYEEKYLKRVRLAKSYRRKPCRFSMTGNHSVFLVNFKLRKMFRISKDSALYYDYIAEGWVRTHVKDWNTVPLDAVDTSYRNK